MLGMDFFHNLKIMNCCLMDLLPNQFEPNNINIPKPVIFLIINFIFYLNKIPCEIFFDNKNVHVK
jgi:hypothetical protein